MSGILVISLIIVSAGILTSIISVYLKRRQASLQVSRTVTLTERMTEIANVYMAMDEMVADGTCDRFIMFKGSNGGSVPRLGSDYNIKVLYPAAKAIDKSDFIKNYSLVADGQYVNMLVQIMRERFVGYFSEIMPDGILKSILRHEKINYCEVYYLANNKDELIFCTIESASANFDENQKLKITLEIERIRRLFAKYYYS